MAVVTVLLPIGAAAAVWAAGWAPTGDVGTIGLRSRDVGTTDTPLLGQPTTGASITHVDSWHPGPAEFWVLAPFTRLLGARAGLLLGPAVVNCCAIAATLVLARRRGGTTLVALVCAAIALLARSVGAQNLATAYNSEFPTFLLFAAIMAMWSVLDGDLVAVPVVVATVSLASQAHVAVAAQLALPSLVTGAALIWHLMVRSPTPRQRRALVAGLALGILVWAPVAAQELSAGPSNLTAMRRSAAAPVEKAGFAFAFERLATAVSPRPVFAQRADGAGVMAEVSFGRVLAGMALLGASGSLALAGTPTVGRRTARALAGLLAVVIAWSVICTAAVPREIAGFRLDALRWLWVVGAWVWLSILWNIWRLLGRQRATWWKAKVAIGCALVVFLVATITVTGFDLRDLSDEPEMIALGPVVSKTIDATEEGTYHLEFGDAKSYITAGAGFALLLDESDRRIEVDPGTLTYAYGNDRTTRNRDVDGRLRLTTDPTSRARKNERLIASEPVAGGDLVMKVFLSR